MQLGLPMKANVRLIILQVKQRQERRVHENVRMANSLRGEVLNLLKKVLSARNTFLNQIKPFH